MAKSFLAALVVSLVATIGAAQAQEFDIESVDANRDGAVTRAEAHAARVVIFNRADLDHNDALSAAERQVVVQTVAARGARALDRADVNHDGLVSTDEFMSQPYRAFDLFDWNRDGVLSPVEIAALRTGLGQR